MRFQRIDLSANHRKGLFASIPQFPDVDGFEYDGWFHAERGCRFGKVSPDYISLTKIALIWINILAVWLEFLGARLVVRSEHLTSLEAASERISQRRFRVIN
jgi:hypothetical protein